MGKQEVAITLESDATTVDELFDFLGTVEPVLTVRVSPELEATVREHLSNGDTGAPDKTLAVRTPHVLVITKIVSRS